MKFKTAAQGGQAQKGLLDNKWRAIWYDRNGHQCVKVFGKTTTDETNAQRYAEIKQNESQT